jgi:hypothetical protein
MTDFGMIKMATPTASFHRAEVIKPLGALAPITASLRPFAATAVSPLSRTPKRK